MRKWIALGAVLCGTAGCGSPAMHAPPTPLRIATTNASVGEALIALFEATVPEVEASAEPPETSRFNLRAIETGAADVGFVRADLAYAAYRRGTPLHLEPHSRLRGVAVMGMSLLHIIVSTESRARTLEDLRGRRVGLMSISPDATQRMAREGDLGFYRSLLLATGKLSEDDIRTMPLSTREMIDALAAGELGAGLFMGAHPAPAPVMDALGRATNIRLVEVPADAAARIRAEFPFYKPAEVPAGTYREQRDAISTVGVEFLLVCSADLSEELVYQLVRALFESAGEVEEMSELARALDPVHASATPIALHPGAARYYRERELPRY